MKKPYNRDPFYMFVNKLREVVTGEEPKGYWDENSNWNEQPEGSKGVRDDGSGEPEDYEMTPNQMRSRDSSYHSNRAEGFKKNPKGNELYILRVKEEMDSEDPWPEMIPEGKEPYSETFGEEDESEYMNDPFPKRRK